METSETASSQMSDVTRFLTDLDGMDRLRSCSSIFPAGCRRGLQEGPCRRDLDLFWATVAKRELSWRPATHSTRGHFENCPASAQGRSLRTASALFINTDCMQVFAKVTMWQGCRLTKVGSLSARAFFPRSNSSKGIGRSKTVRLKSAAPWHRWLQWRRDNRRAPTDQSSESERGGDIQAAIGSPNRRVAQPKALGHRLCW